MGKYILSNVVSLYKQYSINYKNYSANIIHDDIQHYIPSYNPISRKLNCRLNDGRPISSIPVHTSKYITGTSKDIIYTSKYLIGTSKYIIFLVTQFPPT